MNVLRAVLIATVITVCLGLSPTAQPKQPQWKMQACYTLNDVTTFLNKLTPAQALEAKVLAINSQRSVLGSLSNPYYVWYR